FLTIFDDGRYVRNLAQYSTSRYQIGNGQITVSAIDPADLPNRISDAQIRQEIAAGINAGALPFPDANTLYYIFTPPGVVVTWDDGEDSAHNFHGYHSYDGRGGFAYAVIPFNDVGLYEMTRTCSHELAEAVTDPQ